MDSAVFSKNSQQKQSTFREQSYSHPGRRHPAGWKPVTLSRLSGGEAGHLHGTPRPGDVPTWRPRDLGPGDLGPGSRGPGDLGPGDPFSGHPPTGLQYVTSLEALVG